jgi:hypothetical protein
MSTRSQKFRYILIELAHHLPYSIFSVAMALIIMGTMTFLAILIEGEHRLPIASQKLFHILHPSHVLFSAVTTTAMFWKHEKRTFKALLVGLIGSVTICGLSDVFLPFIGGNILGYPMHFHICLLQEPGLVFPFALVGIFAGRLITHTFDYSTEYSHSAHVLVSSMASILYIIAFGVPDWINAAGGIFLITVIAVMIPCCLSDIAFPIFCIHRDCNHGDIEEQAKL